MDDASIRTANPRIGILVVVIATVVRGVFVVLQLLADAGVIETDRFQDLVPVPVYPSETFSGLVTRAGLWILLIVSLLTVVGLLTRRRWAWTLAIVTAGTILALDIAWWATGEPRYVSMLVNSIVVFYLNQRDLRAAFRVSG